MDSIDPLTLYFCIIPIGVLIVFGFMVGLAKHNRDIAQDRYRLAQGRYRNRYRSRTQDRQELIEKLRKDGNDFEHIALVLNTAGYHNQSGNDFTANEVAQEHAWMAARADRLQKIVKSS